MTARDRLHALDAARAFALLLGIVLHATMSFFLFIPAQDVSQSTTLGVTFYVIHIFRMSLFYFLAGYFAHLAFHRRGTRAFVKDRAKRILVPMTAGWIVLAPPTIAAVIWGLSRSFPDGPPAGADASAIVPQGFPLIHLWFLYYLAIFYALALVLRAAFVALVDRNGVLRARIDTAVRRALSSYVAPIAFAAPIFGVLYLNEAWPVWFGIPTPDTGFMPKIPALVGFGTAFAAGWVMHRQTVLLGVLEKQWRVNLALAVALTAACLAIVGVTPNMAATTIVEGGAGMRALYAAFYTASIWYWTFGLIGAAMRFCSDESPVRRYLADASYWLYLGHLPIVFGLQAALMSVPLHWTIKFPLIVAIAMAVLLVSYHYLVRPTWLGALLNGRKVPRRKRVARSREPDPGAPGPLSAGPGADGSGPGGPGARESRDSSPAARVAPVAPVALLGNVTKRYGSTVALDRLTLNVTRGELLAVLGPNGAGKSTAIALWLGLLEPEDGIVCVMDGSPLDVLSRLDVGVMMQDVNLTPELCARELIALTRSYYRNPLRVEETIALAGIEAIADKRYAKLSGGQKRQVQFALAVCGRPQLLFLDEPTVGLDVRAREAMWRAIRRLLADGCSIVLTTHYLEEAEALADRVAVLAKGKLVAEGSVDEMRALVARKKISCASAVEVDDVKQWPGVVEAVREDGVVHVTAFDAESVVRRLLATDENLSRLEVKQASLAEAFTELTKEAA
jgi:ABC-type multidrug transport system ATPase subunit/fucose 4-O-acetylase-like acetyltransferase